MIYGMRGQCGQLTWSLPDLYSGTTFTDVRGRPVLYIKTGVHFLVLLIALLCIAQVAEGQLGSSHDLWMRP